MSTTWPSTSAAPPTGERRSSRSSTVRGACPSTSPTIPKATGGPSFRRGRPCADADHAPTLTLTAGRDVAPELLRGARRMIGVEPVAVPLPPPIMIGPEGSYAWDVFHRRHVKLIANVIDALPYSGGQVAGLRGLLAESIDGVMTPLPPGAPDARLWREWDRGHYGKPWVHAPFLWAESYFFRRILEAVGYHGSADIDAGAWRHVDPYAPMKDAELADPQLDAAFGWYDGLGDVDAARRFTALVEASVLGNRADLVFQVTEVVENYSLLSPPLADDTGRILEHLTGREPGRVAVVCDNAGRELLGDLLLVHDLLAEGWATSVDLHVKPDPYYISDTTAADVGKTLNRLRAIDRKSVV